MAMTWYHVLSAPVVMDSSSDDAKNDDMTVGQCEAGETNSNFECSIKLEESHHSASTHDLVDKHLRGGSYEVYTEGDYDEDYYSDQLSERTDRFQITEVRMAFIRKVYTLLFLQLALTTAYVALFIFIDDLRRFALRNYEIFQVCLLIQFILVIVLTCCPQTRRRSPLNLILFFLFTATFGYCLGVVSVQYDTSSVILTFGICTVCCLAVTIFAFTTTIDFTKFGIYLFIAFICFTVSLFILLFVWAPLAHKALWETGDKQTHKCFSERIAQGLCACSLSQVSTRSGSYADALSGSNTGDGTNDMKRSVTFAGSYSTPSSENTVPARVEGTGSILRGSYGGSSTYTDFRMRGFNDKEVRTGFIRKVYSLLFAMLAVTTGILACCIFIDDARRFVMQQYEVAYIAIGIYFVSVFIIQCCPGLLRQHPMNLIVLILYTLSLGYMVVFISLYYKTQSVLLAFGICSACCFSITIFALTTTIDFTKCGIYLTIALICFMVFSFIMIFVQAPMAHKIYAAIGAVLFMGILLFNTQLIIGGKEFELSPDEYVVAAILLYASIIQIFLFILELLGERRR
ncbi:protein lifeguard 2-like isoform X2 [Varroa jacobsoni]|uniref:protein lifeguard 2-like isoform X2 n=1 Tax=Varroa jacobsoni TaxID=62625 RepID=UPI000BF3F697|nr:protein lifeguard 2-like isoform X2 [Varroa jacobsoni]